MQQEKSCLVKHCVSVVFAEMLWSSPVAALA